jgi:hypothetical protein
LSYSVPLLPFLLATDVRVDPRMSLVVATLLVAIPVLIGLLGLPHREPPAGHLNPGSGQLTDSRESPVP